MGDPLPPRCEAVRLECIGGIVTDTANRLSAGSPPARRRICHRVPMLLAIYPNDHLAGATAGRELARPAAASDRGSSYGPCLLGYSP
jgi:hypothetical protein